MESLACHPPSTTHSELSAEELARAGVTHGTVRLSVGVEDVRDLLADLEQALVAAPDAPNTPRTGARDA